MSFFDSLDLQPPDAIFGLDQTFREDTRTNKTNLCVGAYKNGSGQSVIFNSVRKAEQRILKEQLMRDYLPGTGDPAYIQLSKKLVFGEGHSALTEGRIAACQTLGGTGALRVGGELIARFLSKNIYISSPTWANHRQIFTFAGMNIETYPYYNEATKALDFKALTAAVREMPEGSVLLLQGCCHNPTGLDPTFPQWQTLSDIIKEKKLIPFFDLAYQGLGEGLEEDPRAVQYFAEQGHDMLVASSYSKNFGLYGERVGVLFVVSSNAASTPKTESNLKKIIRCNYSNPPTHGAKIVTTILASPELKKEWMDELRQMRERIQEMRSSLIAGLQTKGKSDKFIFMTNQKGMFSYSGLDENQVHQLRVKNGIYMPKSGRINVAGLNKENMNYIIESILSVL